MPSWMYSEKKPCGTSAAYDRHIKHPEKYGPPCRPCREANARRWREQNKLKRQRPRATAKPQEAASTRAPTWWCVIAAAEGLEWDGQPSYEVRREMADSHGLDPWAAA